MIDANMSGDPIEALAVDFITRQRHGEFLSVPDYARGASGIGGEDSRAFPIHGRTGRTRSPEQTGNERRLGDPYSETRRIEDSIMCSVFTGQG